MGSRILSGCGAGSLPLSATADQALGTDHIIVPAFFLVAYISLRHVNVDSRSLMSKKT